MRRAGGRVARGRQREQLMGATVVVAVSYSLVLRGLSNTLV